jgi:hypothetical protein
MIHCLKATNTKKAKQKNCWLRTDIESFIATKFSNNSKF